MDTLWHAGLSNAAWAVGLALLAAIVARWGRRPALTHGLWVLVLVKLVTPPFWSVVLPQFQRGAIEDGVRSAAPGSPEIRPALDQPLPEDSTGSDTLIPEPSPHVVDGSALVDSTPSTPSVPIPWTSVLLGIALTGSAAWFLLAGWRLAQFRKLLRGAQPAPEGVQEQVRRLAQGLGLSRFPSAWLVPGAVSPMLWAVLGKARLLLPAALWERLEDNQRAALLVHELAHLRRRDHWVRRLEFVATGLYWWHPVVWWARRAIERAEEECCDAWVVWLLPQAARAYAEALLETVDFLSEVRCPLPPAVSGIGHVHFLRRRLAMIMQGTCTRKLSRLGLWGLIGLGALVLPLLPGLGPDQSAAAAQDDPARVAAGRESSEPPASARGREQARPAIPPAPRAPGARVPAEEVQNARDEVELLEVQLQGKHAELQESRTRIMIAERHRAQMKNLHDKGAASSELLAKAQDDADLAKAQLQAKEVQVKEAQVRLNQAQRRLARLQAPSPEEKGAALVWPPAKLEGPDGGLAARRAQLHNAIDWYQRQLKEKRPTSPAEAKDIEEFLQRLKSELGALEGKRIIRGPTEGQPPPEVLKLRKELEGATRELEQYKARVEERQRAQQALAEAQRAAAQQAEAKAKQALKARNLQKELDEPREAKKTRSTAELKSVEERLNALTKEMEALRREIRDLADRQGRAPAEKKVPPLPAKR